MKVLVIPDVHLKPFMFQQAATLMKQGIAERVVCLMDIPDDWNKEYDCQLYEETYDEAICGYSTKAAYLVQKKLLDLRSVVPEDHPIQYIQKIDNVLFCHGGMLNYFVEEYVSKSKYDDVDQVLKIINKLGRREMWNQASPIWLRPQNSRVRLYKPRKLLQVVGHTPMTEITREGNVISCDVFSTYRDGRPIGTQEFLLLDTQTWEYCGVKLH